MDSFLKGSCFIVKNSLSKYGEYFSGIPRGYVMGGNSSLLSSLFIESLFLKYFLLNLVKTLEITWVIRYILPVFQGGKRV